MVVPVVIGALEVAGAVAVAGVVAVVTNKDATKAMGDALDSGIQDIKDAWDSATAPKAKTIPTTKAEPVATSKTTDRKCDPTQDKSCNKQKHSGRIQAQEDKITYKPAAATGSAWTDLPKPPTLAMCSGYAQNCRAALASMTGTDRGKGFQAGADVAHQNLLTWLKKNTPAGISVKTNFKISFYFNGDKGAVNLPITKHKGKNSKRMDFDLIKGEALKG